MRRGKWVIIAIVILLFIGIGVVFLVEPEYGYVPPNEKVVEGLNIPQVIDYRNNATYDFFGETINEQDLEKTDKEKLSPENGAVKINDELIEIGRKAFYEETFKSEMFLTDIMGVIDGAFTLPNVAKAILALKGEGTTNLRVKLAKDVTIGGKTFKKGEKVDTGIDVPKGAYAPLGMPVKFAEGKFKVGISCALCHATLDKNTHMVIEGAPNADLDAGLLMALATNSTAYFTHGEKSALKKYLTSLDMEVDKQNWQTALPDPAGMERTVDETLMKWPAGNFDSTIDLKGNPAQIPDSFTLGDHPYGWSGFASVGPFKGLSAFNSNVHAQNSDSLAQVGASEALFGLDKEVYLGTILQNAADPKFRFDPKGEESPSEFFKSIDPNPENPGVNELVRSPEYPKVTPLSPDGMMISSPGYNVWEQVHGMSAFQNRLIPPKPDRDVDPEKVTAGEEIFNKAGCISCHAGEALTNNTIIPVDEIGTEPSRAKALKKTEKIFGDSTLYAPNTPVPIPKNPRVIQVPSELIDEGKIKIGFAHGDSNGGYKVPSLIGLYWTAPYLHDGGVAVGENSSKELGLPGTVIEGVDPDPVNSLRALIDQQLRQQVISANQSSQHLSSVHVTGEGHEFWVDESTGFSKQEQDALIEFLLSYQ